MTQYNIPHNYSIIPPIHPIQNNPRQSQRIIGKIHLDRAEKKKKKKKSQQLQRTRKQKKDQYRALLGILDNDSIWHLAVICGREYHTRLSHSDNGPCRWEDPTTRDCFLGSTERGIGIGRTGIRALRRGMFACYHRPSCLKFTSLLFVPKGDGMITMWCDGWWHDVMIMENSPGKKDRQKETPCHPRNKVLELWYPAYMRPAGVLNKCLLDIISIFDVDDAVGRVIYRTPPMYLKHWGNNNKH